MNLGLRIAVRPEADDVAGTSLATTRLGCRTAFLHASRSPAVFQDGRQLALFLPDVLTDLPSACRTAAPLASIFDTTVCELPGHGGSDEVADVSPTGFAHEYAAMIDLHMPPRRRLTLIGAGFGGLLALEVARLRSERVARVILLDTPFVLTRGPAAALIAQRQRSAPSAYRRRILRETLGVDPDSGASSGRAPLYDMVEGVDFPCAILAGADAEGLRRAPSMLTDADLDALHAANGDLLIPARLEAAGHDLLDDDPDGCMAVLARLIGP